MTLTHKGRPVADWIAEFSTEDEHGCWIWSGSFDSKGYPRLPRIGKGRDWYAHRASYEAFRGPIPDGLVVDHVCFVPACVNPAHLQLLTMPENSRRQRKALADACQRGHEFTEENTRWQMRGGRPMWRQCRTCRRAAEQARRARKRAGRMTLPLYGVLYALAVAMTPALLAALVLMRGAR